MRPGTGGLSGASPRVNIEQVANIDPDGMPVSILSITDHNMPFLYESAMGEVTSSYRDLYMAVHPILVIEDGKQPTLYSADQPSDPAHRVSHIQLHLVAPDGCAGNGPDQTRANRA